MQLLHDEQLVDDADEDDCDALLLGEHGQGSKYDWSCQPLPPRPPVCHLASVRRPRVREDGWQVEDGGQELSATHHPRHSLSVDLKFGKIKIVI